MKRDEIIAIMRQAKDANVCVGVLLTIPGQDQTEMIVNASESIDNKIEYYQKTYNEDGVHNNCPDIKMVDAALIYLNPFLLAFHPQFD